MIARAFLNTSAQGWVPFLLGTTLPARPFVPGKGVVELLERVGYASGATRVALSRLCAEGAVERQRDGRQTRYRMSSEAAVTFTAISARIDRFGRDLAWDGTWTIVLASVPDEQRSVRRRMKSGLAYLGFGRLREAAWIAARDRQEEVGQLVGSLELADMIDVFVGRPSELADVDAILHRCWDVESLTTRYEDFASHFAPLKTASACRALSGEDTVRWWMRLAYEYRDLVFRDPELPEEYLPRAARSLRARAVETYTAVYDGLRERAVGEVLRALGAA